MECDECLADAMFYDWSITFCKAFAQQKCHFPFCYQSQINPKVFNRLAQQDLSNLISHSNAPNIKFIFAKCNTTCILILSID